MKVNKCSFTSNDDSLSFETNDQATVGSPLLKRVGKVSAENPLGSAHAAGSPPCSRCLGQRQLQRNAATAGMELAVLLSQPSATSSFLAPIPAVAVLIDTCPQEGWHRRVPELQTANKIFQEPSG